MPSVGSSSTPTWLATSAEPTQAERLAQSQPFAVSGAYNGMRPSSIGQNAKSSTSETATGMPTASDAATSTRSVSYDFTRKALLDLIRRTNLGMKSDTSSSKTPIGPNTDPTPGNQTETASTTAIASRLAADPSGSMSARLYSWQQHRKRARLSDDFASGLPGQASTSVSGYEPHTPGKDMSTMASAVGGQPRPPKRSSTEEDEQKARKQEQYRRLLLQLNAQMQMRMQMDLQKRQQKESSDAALSRASFECSERKDDNTQFKKPSPPSKTSGALQTSPVSRDTSDAGKVASTDPPTAMRLMMKHPNWSRDADTPSLIPVSSRDWRRHQSSFATNNGDMFPFSIPVESTTIGSLALPITRPYPQASPDKQRTKRPFSPGAEVVFWAVKGEHSVKLVGKVQSMTDRSADVVVAPRAASTITPYKTSAASTLERSDGDAQPEHVESECYRNVPFVNIIAKDQAKLLSLF
ncbi:hypothetical protein PSEUBRA_003997 [Kalmanozyma brasiliensis GHG001]|uniref:uncharacterized protein n=1 Tax=Kalmanozyma brasiliensis (strain GHG001) TaxID=1365824 RepID=UPI002867B351|nr:uncharacterized protein PSEUBRA_003997 [Kalmanozyma brasiliensis GHG001]EST06128.2 hypothetical protein PSEUBRA_003997 [Kalmanozyma brasiliensis GHG001]